MIVWKFPNIIKWPDFSQRWLELHYSIKENELLMTYNLVQELFINKKLIKIFTFSFVTSNEVYSKSKIE